MNGDQQLVTLDNKTIAKLAATFAYAVKLYQEGEVIGPAMNKILLHLDGIDNLNHFKSYRPKA